MIKLEKSSFPAGCGPQDYECYGPAAIKDGVFDGTMIADMGCFNQAGVDSNKYYHAAVVFNTRTQKWGVYLEWGRVGAKNPQYQLIECSSKEEAIKAYIAQCQEKNSKRGEWVELPGIGRTLRAKAGKDCYLVRPQATRSTGLPSAKTIKTNDVIKPVAKKSTKKVDWHENTSRLLRDLNMGTISYTKGAMSNESIPTLAALDEADLILNLAMKRISLIGNNPKDQANDKELYEYTRTLYGRIPKKKELRASEESWILSESNITTWQLDLAAFRNALQITDAGDEVESNPFGNNNIHFDWLDPKTTTAKFIHQWMPQATRNVHHTVGNLNIKNIWTYSRLDDEPKWKVMVEKVANDSVNPKARPLHQPDRRPDAEKEISKQYELSHTTLLFHGTRSVNVSGILREDLRMPKQLVGVSINGALLGPGIYFADDWKKSAGYTSIPESHWVRTDPGRVAGRDGFMFISEVILGNPHTADKMHGYTSAPQGCHSVFGKAQHTHIPGYGILQNNEWVVYQKYQHRLRYLVEFSAPRYR